MRYNEYIKSQGVERMTTEKKIKAKKIEAGIYEYCGINIEKIETECGIRWSFYDDSGWNTVTTLNAAKALIGSDFNKKDIDA